MKIIQLIDSLEIGGAEKMAVNYANALSEKIEFSGLVVTRKEGKLKEQLLDSVSYLFLKRKRLLDWCAIFRLKKFIKHNKVTHIQAHSSSFFTAVLVKFLYFKVKIIWHDHNGYREFLNFRNNIAIKIASLFFEEIIVVNYQLLQWAKRNLFCKKILYLPNFTVLEINQYKITILKGIHGNRIICVANLRFPKNHFFLLDIANSLKEKYPDWTFHLLGRVFKDEYSDSLNLKIKELQLENIVFLYGAVSDVQSCIEQADIAIITSQSEGLPVVLLEYGLLEKPIVSTSVGEIPKIITHGFNGFLSEKKDVIGFASNLSYLIENEEQRKYLAANLKNTIEKNHGKTEIITQFLNWISH
jgi:glycosyltransferase involved in cell wall biosynthesis